MSYTKILGIYSLTASFLVLGLAYQNGKLKKGLTPEDAFPVSRQQHQFDYSGTPIIGDPEAPVTLTVFSEFECPHCAETAETLHAIVREYDDQVRVAFKHLPLNQHQNAKFAAAASMAAHSLGYFEAMHETLFTIQDNLTPDHIRTVAESMSLDMVAFDKWADPELWEPLFERDRREAIRAGVQGVPYVYINGVHHPKPTFTALKAAIDQLLENRTPAI